METVLARLINDLTSKEGDFVLVLDDYHVITAEPIHRALIFLLEHGPPQMHLVIATRLDPPLPLTRLRARGQLIEVRAAQLQFALTEASVFLNSVMGLDLPSQDIATLQNRTEGWIAGLQLAALSLQDTPMRSSSSPTLRAATVISSITWSRRCSPASLKMFNRFYYLPPSSIVCQGRCVMQ